MRLCPSAHTRYVCVCVYTRKVACVIENVVLRKEGCVENEIALCACLSESERRGRDTNATDSAEASTLTWAHVVPTQRKRKLVSSKAGEGERRRRGSSTGEIKPLFDSW